MIHAKSMVIDGLWTVVGSTNFDHRSFGHNDEVNLTAADKSFAGRLLADFAQDLPPVKGNYLRSVAPGALPRTALVVLERQA